MCVINVHKSAVICELPTLVLSLGRGEGSLAQNL